MCMTAFFFTDKRCVGSALLVGCVEAGLGLIVRCVSPRALSLRRGGSYSWYTGGIRDTICISRIGTALHHAVRCQRSIHSWVEVGLSSKWGAAEARGWGEARGTIWLPLVNWGVQGQHLKWKEEHKMSEGQTRSKLITDELSDAPVRTTDWL